MYAIIGKLFENVSQVFMNAVIIIVIWVRERLWGRKIDKKKILLWHTLPPADTEDYDLNISFNFLVTNKYKI